MHDLWLQCTLCVFNLTPSLNKIPTVQQKCTKMISHTVMLTILIINCFNHRTLKKKASKVTIVCSSPTAIKQIVTA